MTSVAGLRCSVNRSRTARASACKEAELLTTGAVFVADKRLGKSASPKEGGVELVCAKFLTGAVRELVGIDVCESVCCVSPFLLLHHQMLVRKQDVLYNMVCK